jgi:phenylpropionate dioxygenase-like ring-hydroxylating dioxygenase large terminal subunit
MPVVEFAGGTAESFTCPYHLWRYGLDGRLLEAPGMAGSPGFDAEQCRLPAFAVEVWRGFVFVNFDQAAPPLAEQLGRVGDDLANYPLGEMTQVATWAHEWKVNWKLAAQNVHENYHVAGLHPDTIAQITPRDADTDVRIDSPWVTCLRTPLNQPLDAAVVPLREEQRRYMYHWIVFPYGSLQAFGDALIWLSIVPLGIDRTQVRGGVLLPSSLVTDDNRERLRDEALATPDIVNADDKRALEALQRTVGSRFAGPGHLSPKEPGVLVFYRNLARSLLG